MKKNIGLTPMGTRDLLFEECLARREVEGRLCRLFQLRGFSEVMTPGIEFFDLFQIGNGVMPVENMCKLTDARGRLLVMRPDSTIPIARLAATRLQSAPLPIRLYYAQDVFHVNYGLSGHSDQQFQAGIELIGAPGEKADLEVLALAAEALGQITEDFRLDIGHVGFFESLVQQLQASQEIIDDIRTHIEWKNYAGLSQLLDTLPQTPAVDAIRRLPRLFGGEEVLTEAAAYCHNGQTKAVLESLSNLYHALKQLGLGKQVMIDLGLLHRNEYYTGVVFCGYIQGSGETVVSGGRYDSLLQQFGSPLPATGFGINVDAVTKRMLRRGEAPSPTPPKVLIHAEAEAQAIALRKAAELTNQGITCEYSIFDTLQQSLDYALQRGIAQVLHISGQTAQVRTLHPEGRDLIPAEQLTKLPE